MSSKPQSTGTPWKWDTTLLDREALDALLEVDEVRARIRHSAPLG